VAEEKKEEAFGLKVMEVSATGEFGMGFT